MLLRYCRWRGSVSALASAAIWVQSCSTNGCEPRSLASIAILAARWKSGRSEEHTSELQSLMRISYAVFCLKKNRKESNTDKGAALNATDSDMKLKTTTAMNLCQMLLTCTS